MILRLLGLNLGRTAHAEPPPGSARAGRRSAAPRVRPVVRTTRGVEVSEGQGMRLRRLIGSPEIDMVDPFLLLDWFTAEPAWRQQVGFPDHPHLGVDAVTYIVSGAMRHKDNRDNEATVEAGGVQWMTASGGVVRSEFAEQREDPLCGYRLWINLPSREKRVPPEYRALPAEDLPVEERAGAEVVVIAGTTSAGTGGAMNGRETDPLILAVRLDPDASFVEEISVADNAFFVVHDGDVICRDARGQQVVIGEGEAAITGPGAEIRLTAGFGGAEILFAAARPLREPVARAGAIVMNTRSEVMEALRSYREGRL